MKRCNIDWLAVFIVLAILVFCVAIAYFAWIGVKATLREAISQDHIPTFTEIQQQLVDRGHNIKVDGIIGKETLRAWERELCDQYASDMFKRMAGAKK